MDHHVEWRGKILGDGTLAVCDRQAVRIAQPFEIERPTNYDKDQSSGSDNDYGYRPFHRLLLEP
jgi:hypothetical protein